MEAASRSIEVPAVAPSGTAGREIVLTREYAAPRALVWEAWTRPEHVSRWWGPDGFRITTYEMDVRPGGVWRFLMHGPDGTDYPNRMTYLEVVEPERLVCWHGADRDDDPHRFEVTVTFEEVEGGRTRVSNRMVFATAAQRDATVNFGAVELGNQTMARLEGYLATL